MHKHKLTVVVLIVFGLTVRAHAEGATESVVVLPNEIVWKPAPVSPGPEVAVLYGDPTRTGVYVMRVRFPAGLKLLHTSTRTNGARV